MPCGTIPLYSAGQPLQPPGAPSSSSDLCRYSYPRAGGGIYCRDHTALRNCVVMLQLISAQRLRSRLELRGLGQGNSFAIGRLLLTFTFTIITSSYF